MFLGQKVWWACDCCKKEGYSFGCNYPDNWIIIKLVHGTKHFCSKKCHDKFYDRL